MDPVSIAKLWRFRFMFENIGEERSMLKPDLGDILHFFTNHPTCDGVLWFHKDFIIQE